MEKIYNRELPSLKPGVIPTDLDLVVEGNAYIKGNFVRCCIGIKDGKIAEIKKILEGDTHLDFEDDLILPAAIDIHVHFRDPGYTYKEDFATGTISAAFGGVSCIFDMPNTKPPATSIPTFKEKLNDVGKKACIDFGLYAGISEKTDIVSLGKICSAFKIYMGSTTGEMHVTDELLEKAVKEIGKTKKVAAVHAEDEKLRKKNEPENLSEHLFSRPNQCEASAIKKLIEINNKNAGKSILHVSHVSARESIDILKETKLTKEVTPHHLFLNSGMKLDAFGKVNPPLRTREDQLALWDALNKGIIDVIASDHAPHTIEEKETEFSKAPSGIPGVETMLPLMLSATKQGKISIQRVVNAIAERPGEIFGLNKGRIEKGKDADFSIVNLKDEVKIKSDKLHYKCGWSPFDGFTAVFPHTLIVRGGMVVDKGVFVGRKGFGKYVTKGH